MGLFNWVLFGIIIKVLLVTRMCDTAVSEGKEYITKSLALQNTWPGGGRKNKRIGKEKCLWD